MWGLTGVARAMSHLVRLLPCLAAAVLVCACASTAPEDDAADASTSSGIPDGPCVAGQSIVCECANGSMGAAICRDDGSGYDECTCDGGGPGSGGPGSGSQGDTDGVTSETSEPPTGGSEEGDSSSDTESAEISFEDDIKPILVASCGGTVDACHSRVAYGANVEFDCRGWVSLEDAAIGTATDNVAR